MVATNVLPIIDPMKLTRRQTAFTRSGWVFELKYDGFRGVAYIHNQSCKIVSRNGLTFTRFSGLARSLPPLIMADEAILDGEIVALDDQGIPRVDALTRGEGRAVFAAFDLLWLNGEDLRSKPLLERKALLRERMTSGANWTLCVSHLEKQGEALFREACRLDLEGIVAKPAGAAYRQSRWFKIKNPNYTQIQGRAARFKDCR